MTLKILVVDDDSVKVDAIAGLINSLQLADIEFHSVGDVSEARKELSIRAYDIMLLDILLPVRKGATPRADSSVDFLREIIEDGTCPAPKRIVAITSDETTLARHSPEFGQLVTQSLLVDPARDDWRYSLDRLISHARTAVQAAFNFDICIQTALREPELSQLVKIKGVDWQAEEPLANGVLYRRGQIDRDGRRFTIACTHAPQMGMVAAAHLTSLVIEKLRPRVLIMSGICGAVDGSVKLGDLIVADRSWDWQSGKWNDNGELEIAPEQKESSAQLIADARSLEAMMVEWFAEYDGVKPSAIPVVRISPIVSGSSVVADSSFHSTFKRQHRKVGAVDMECYGVYYASSMCDHPQPKYICIKGVSDSADKSKADDIQAFCSYLSAKAALYVAVRTLSRDS